jgi:hypothetical protein
MPIGPHLLTIVDVLTNVITPIIALLAFVIAIREAITNRSKLRLELYDRRFAIYSRALDYFQAVAVYDASPELLANLLVLRRDFLKSVEEAKFLFEGTSGIPELLFEMYRKSFERTGSKEISGELSAGGAHDEVIAGFAKSEEALRWLAESLPLLAKSMAPYLDFHKRSG